MNNSADASVNGARSGTAKESSTNKQEEAGSWRELSFLERQRHLLESGQLSDCTFVVTTDTDMKQTEVFKCHKYVLCQSSDVFEAMFYGGLAEQGAVKVNDIHPKYFHKMIEYIYTEHLEMDCVETAIGVYYAADKYIISALRSKCQQFVMQFLSVSDVCKTLEFSLLIGNKELEDFSIQKLCDETEKILSDDSFVDAEVSTLLTLLKQDKLRVTSEGTLFSACLLWAQARVTEQSSLRDILEPVLHLFRFKTMSGKEFAEIVCKSNVLMQEEEHSILICIVCDRDDMPHGFSNESKIRENPLQKILIARFSRISGREIAILSLPLHEPSAREQRRFSEPFKLFVYLTQLETNDVVLQGVHLMSRSQCDYEEVVNIQYFDVDNDQPPAFGSFQGKVTGNHDVVVFFDKPYPALRPRILTRPCIIVRYMTNCEIIPFYCSSCCVCSTQSGITLNVGGQTTIKALILLRK